MRLLAVLLFGGISLGLVFYARLYVEDELKKIEYMAMGIATIVCPAFIVHGFDLRSWDYAEWFFAFYSVGGVAFMAVLYKRALRRREKEKEQNQE